MSSKRKTTKGTPSRKTQREPKEFSRDNPDLSAEQELFLQAVERVTERAREDHEFALRVGKLLTSVADARELHIEQVQVPDEQVKEVQDGQGQQLFTPMVMRLRDAQLLNRRDELACAFFGVLMAAALKADPPFPWEPFKAAERARIDANTLIAELQQYPAIQTDDRGERKPEEPEEPAAQEGQD